MPEIGRRRPWKVYTGVPFSWKDLTPLARLALDEFILWVNTDRPDKKEFKSAREYVAAVKEKPGTFKMGGTGTAQEDQIDPAGAGARA